MALHHSSCPQRSVIVHRVRILTASSLIGYQLAHTSLSDRRVPMAFRSRMVMLFLTDSISDFT